MTRTPPDPLLVRTWGQDPREIVAVRPPGSKSITNRALLLAALAEGESELRGALCDADDARRMIEAIGRLGARVEASGDEIRVTGVAGRWRVPAGGIELFVNNAGTAARFLAAAALLSPAPVTIDGSPRMRERPIGELGELIRRLGAGVKYLERDGFPPIRVMPPAGSIVGADLSVSTTVSGQFISALLLIAPWLDGGLTLRFVGEVTSRPYIEMTIGLLGQLGAGTSRSGDGSVIRVESAADERGLAAFTLEIEPDASGATYFWAAGALGPGAGVRVEGLGTRSPQGDARFPDRLAALGCSVRDTDGGVVVSPGPLRGARLDMRDMPDAIMTVAVVASFAAGPTSITGARTLRVKETDRIAALQNELKKVGVRVDVSDDSDTLTITPPPGGIDTSTDAARVEFDTYDDHRMAMSLALVGVRRPNVWIRDPDCVGKTYPGFWRDLGMVTSS